MLTRLLSNTYNTVFIALCSMVLSGCVGHTDQEKQLAVMINSRASEITRNLPLKNGGYMLMMARSSSVSTLDLLVYSDAQNTTDDDQQFMNRFSRALCKAADSQALLQHGGTYKIILRRGSNQENVQLIRNANCLSS